MLNSPATIAMPRAVYRHMFTDFDGTGIEAKIIVTSVAPRVCPTSRAVLCIPPAPPVRRTGVAMTITMLFGVWNSPKPMPQIAIRQAMFHTEAPAAGRSNSDMIPIAYTAMPAAAVAPGL